MSHQDAYVTVPKGKGFETARQLLSDAVGIWYDTEANRDDSENAGTPFLLPLMTPSQVIRHQDSDAGRNNSTSYIYPNVNPSGVKKVTKKMKLTVTGEQLALLRQQWHGGLLLDLAYKAFGETVASVKIVKLPALRKSVAKATEGKTETLYYIYGITTSVFGDRATKNERLLSEGIPTMAAARAKALEFADTEAGSKYAELEIRAVVVREGGNTALLTVSRPAPETATVDVEVTFETLLPKATFDSYTVVFDYHS